jgi:hypothetical protein
MICYRTHAESCIMHFDVSLCNGQGQGARQAGDFPSSARPGL